MLSPNFILVFFFFSFPKSKNFETSKKQRWVERTQNTGRGDNEGAAPPRDFAHLFLQKPIQPSSLEYGCPAAGCGGC